MAASLAPHFLMSNSIIYNIQYIQYFWWHYDRKVFHMTVSCDPSTRFHSGSHPDDLYSAFRPIQETPGLFISMTKSRKFHTQKTKNMILILRVSLREKLDWKQSTAKVQ